MFNEDFINLYLRDLELIVNRILRKDIDRVIQLLFETWGKGKQVFLAGNGGSASTATHFACDLAKFTSVEEKKRFRALALTDNMPLFSALTNDLGWENVYVEQLKNMMDEGDVFVVISVHGGAGADKAGAWSQNLVKAAKFVKDNGGKIVGLTGFSGGILKQMADACIVVPIDSTPQVEGFHVVLTHLICARLREMIAQFDSVGVCEEIPQVMK